MISKKILIIGFGGHGKVIAETLIECGYEILGALDSNLDKKGGDFLNIPILGDDSIIKSFERDEILLANGLGSLEGSSFRHKVFKEYRALGYKFCSVIHKSAIVSSSVTVHEGAQILAGAVVQSNAVLMANCLINTSASVDHDSTIGESSHLAPGSLLCGGVTIGADSFVGASATVIQGISVGEGVTIGAGSLIVRNVADGHYVLGAPARIYR